MEMRIDQWVTANIEKLDPAVAGKRSKSCNMKDAILNEYNKQKSIALFVNEAGKMIRSKSLRTRKK